jgi:D-tagatose-1,6-bisphosphate aldolase subunit GatZ/KbaZ
MTAALTALAPAFHAGTPRGITSVCSAHPLVIEAALRLARDTGRPALIEATCNQVNQDGGYTGLTPAAFRGLVHGIAARVGLPTDRIILGGDHLGPNPWRHLPATDALDRAATMVAAYAAAGFTKLHLDCSMGCAGEPAALPDDLTATRAARLAAAAEAHRGATPPVYIIGTEVPVPGGATHALDHLEVTAPEAVARTHATHRDAFARAGADAAFARVVGLVVQPGVEFADADVVAFDPAAARALTATLSDLPGLVFEAHSTDYQTGPGLAGLVRGGFAILKVGPWLTFALREALYALDAVADVLDGHPPRGGLMATMDAVMQASPGNWQRYYHGDTLAMWLKRHFSYSDRIRYYWPDPQVEAAVDALFARLAGRDVPPPVLAQFLPGVAPASDPRDMVIAAVTRVLRLYDDACAG